MESYQIEHLTFTYPNQNKPALRELNLSVLQGEFITLCGASGCGKSTLLRQLKPALAPFGEQNGQIWFEGAPLSQLDARTQSEKIGFVLQSPDNQIVTDKVWHELAFGLESLGYQTGEIRARVAEMASFFGIQTWFHKPVAQLSGGQKQLLNLASVMVLQPSVLILDEPTSQLDPIAAQEFLETLAKVNRELGTTVLLSEHRLEQALPLSHRVIVMEQGEVIANGTPQQAGRQLEQQGHHMFAAFPTPMRVHAGVANKLECPVTVREGRAWLKAMETLQPPDPGRIPAPPEGLPASPTAISLRDVWFRYEKQLPDVVKGLSVDIYQGECYAIVGGNGTGKTTSLSIISGLRKPYRGQVLIYGQPLGSISNKYIELLGVLPQNPQSLFVKKTVELDLLEMLKETKLPKEERYSAVARVSALCQLDELLSRHPYDLSGGEQQRAALAKVLLLRPKILLLDEPTKGLDAQFKQTLADILQQLKRDGVTIVLVSHDIEFCAKYADRCAMFFDGAIVSQDSPRAFFSGKRFYTTAAHRMARSTLPQAILAEDIIAAFGGTPPSRQPALPIDGIWTHPDGEKGQAPVPSGAKPQLTPKKIAWGAFFALLFLLTIALFHNKLTGWQFTLYQITTILELGLCLTNFIPQKQLDSPDVSAQVPPQKRWLPKRPLAALAMVLVAAPLTIYVGTHFLADRKYYFTSLLLILETFVPFVLLFEGRKPQARELVLISVLCAIGVAGRAAFFMLPQFKPVAALVILAGVCLGGETGFLVGAVTAFLSNMLFSQGPWTPWQMFAFGLIGFLAGLLFHRGPLRKTRASLCIFGGLATFILYGGIMNPASVLMWQAKPNLAMVASSYVTGLPFDLVHTASTVFFLWFLSQPMIEKLDRIKVKYGMIR